MGAEGTNKVYAYGKLVLWSAAPDFVKEDKNFILSDKVKKIAVANPKLAPYGEAAYQTMTAWGNLKKAEPKFVRHSSMPRQLTRRLVSSLCLKYSKTER